MARLTAVLALAIAAVGGESALEEGGELRVDLVAAGDEIARQGEALIKGHG